MRYDDGPTDKSEICNWAEERRLDGSRDFYPKEQANQKPHDQLQHIDVSLPRRTSTPASELSPNYWH